MTHRDSFDGKLQLALDRLNTLDAVKRMLARDTSLWSDDASVQSKVHNRLGWLFHLPEMRQQLKRLNEFVRLVERRGHDRVVVIGMGGSSLFPEVIARHLRSKKSLGLQVLDSTHPAALESVRAWAAEGSPLFLVATKSGGTLETLSLYHRMRAHFPDGARYVAIVAGAWCVG